MYKVLQVTDSHLALPGETVFDSDPHQKLEAAINDINRHHADASLCVFTGDLVNNSDPRTYRLLGETIRKIVVPYRIIPGNHDERHLLRQEFPEINVDENGFLQSVMETPAGWLFFLDTVDEGKHSGAYCERRTAWLKRRLDEVGGKPVYIFMHHPPFHIGMKHLDTYVMVDGDRFGDLLAHYSNIRHIFLGHVHRPVTGSWRGIAFSALRSTNHQAYLDLADGDLNICTLEPPSYGVILLDDARTIVHFHDYLDQNGKYAYYPERPHGQQVVRL